MLKEGEVKARATVICRKNDYVLCVRKPGAKWTLPGGKIERGESPSDAALRELEEETGMAARDLIYLARYEREDTTHFVFMAQLQPGDKPAASNEISACRWLPRKHFRNPELSKAAKEIVKGFSDFQPECWRYQRSTGQPSPKTTQYFVTC